MSTSRSVALVTGAGGGIGSAIVAMLAKLGWAVVGIDLVQPPAGLDGVEWVVGDVRDENTMHRALEAAATLGRPNGLVTATLAEHRGPLESLDPPALRSVFDVQVTAAWAWSTALVAEAAGGGELSIVHVSSVHSWRAGRGMAAYAMGKAALEALVRASAVEWGPRGVRCNAVLPGFVPVERNRHRWSDAEQAARLRSAHPLRRFVTAEDVAHVVAFLLGPESRAVTGVSLPVDGGMLAALPNWA